jgi:glycerol-1-phosphatase
VRVRDGLPWVASNTDLSLPTKFGQAPGHGVLVDMLERFSGVKAVVAGKPQRPLLEETIRRLGGTTPLMVGDRLDTDIDGAINAGCDSLLVMTGVTDLAQLVAVPAGRRPTYVAPDLGGLLEAHASPTAADGAAALGGWRARANGTRLSVVGAGSPGDWWRVVAACSWARLDVVGEPVDTAGLEPPEA